MPFQAAFSCLHPSLAAECCCCETSFSFSAPDHGVSPFPCWKLHGHKGWQTWTHELSFLPCAHAISRYKARGAGGAHCQGQHWWEPVAAYDFNKLHLTRSSKVCLLGGHERSWLFWTFCGTATPRSQKQMVSSSECQSSPQFCSQKAAILLKYSQGSKSYLSRKLQS